MNYDLEETVLDMFRSKVEEFPNSIALVMEGKKLTYQELDARSDLWATHLMNLGVLKGSIVGLMMTRSLEMITGILGIMKAGGAYLPINVDQPLSRTHHMLEECDVELILGNVNTDDIVIDSKYTFIEAKKLDLSLEVKKKLSFVEVSNLAYVIYTSGSTGTPKGVMVEHKSVTNLINHEREFLGVNITDKILQFSPYYFDVSVEQIWLALTTGSSLVLLEKDTLIDHQKFINVLVREEITHLNVTPRF
ncbi:AMP-binding protein [Tenacibaculum sp. MAR_2010_89]|uniref:AMP-binding protein n=1 Tax=Tenacibaculum sp. MAR_2010_89 TaxID=1250198 RepID=UPI00115FDB1D|nr:AMP-binding protein [Tenacibaculum sp. MAR_2010_89]